MCQYCSVLEHALLNKKIYIFYRKSIDKCNFTCYISITRKKEAETMKKYTIRKHSPLWLLVRVAEIVLVVAFMVLLGLEV